MCYVLNGSDPKQSTQENFFLYIGRSYRKVLSKLGSFYLHYWFVVVIAMSAMFFIDPQAPVFDAKELILNCLGLSVSYNGSWWYVLQYVKMMLLLPVIAPLFQKFGSQEARKQKGTTYVGLLVILAAGLLFAYLAWPALWTFLLAVGKGLKISYTLPFFVGYLLARYQVYQVLSERIAKFGRFAPLASAVIALAVAIAARMWAAKDAAYAEMDFWIVPVFVYGILTLAKPSSVGGKVFAFFGKVSTEMWLLHIFFFREVFAPIVCLTGASTGIYLTLVALTWSAAYLVHWIYRRIERVIYSAK
jgi:hypothetical protein